MALFEFDKEFYKHPIANIILFEKLDASPLDYVQEKDVLSCVPHHLGSPS